MQQATQQPELGFFAKTPNIVFYGLPGVAISDKWVLSTLVGLCWERNQDNTPRTLKELEGPYRLNLREIAQVTGVKHSALRSYGERTGVLDRLQEQGYVSIIDGNPINSLGQPGHEQTYLYIHLEKIWNLNKDFTPRAPLHLVNADSFTIKPASERKKSGGKKTVNHVDSYNTGNDDTTVNGVNISVNHVDNTVNGVDTTVHQENITVNSSSSNVPPKDSKTTKDTLNTEEDISSNDDSANAPTGDDFFDRAVKEMDSLIDLETYRNNKRVNTGALQPPLEVAEAEETPTQLELIAPDEKTPEPAAPEENKEPATAGRAPGRRRQTKKAAQPGEEKKPAETPKKPTIALSPEASRAWEAWREYHFRRYTTYPRLTETAAGHCETLKNVEWTPEKIKSIADWAYKKLSLQGKMFQLGNLVFAYPRWLDACQPQQTGQQSQAPTSAADASQPAPERVKYTLWSRCQTEEEKAALAELTTTRRGTPRWQELRLLITWQIMTQDEAKASPVAWRESREFTDRELREYFHLNEDEERQVLNLRPRPKAGAAAIA